MIAVNTDRVYSSYQKINKVKNHLINIREKIRELSRIIREENSPVDRGETEYYLMTAERKIRELLESNSLQRCSNYLYGIYCEVEKTEQTLRNMDPCNFISQGGIVVHNLQDVDDIVKIGNTEISISAINDLKEAGYSDQDIAGVLLLLCTGGDADYSGAKNASKAISKIIKDFVGRIDDAEKNGDVRTAKEVSKLLSLFSGALGLKSSVDEWRKDSSSENLEEVIANSLSMGSKAGDVMEVFRLISDQDYLFKTLQGAGVTADGLDLVANVIKITDCLMQNDRQGALTYLDELAGTGFDFGTGLYELFADGEKAIGTDPGAAVAGLKTIFSIAGTFAEEINKGTDESQAVLKAFGAGAESISFGFISSDNYIDFCNSAAEYGLDFIKEYSGKDFFWNSFVAMAGIVTGISRATGDEIENHIGGTRNWIREFNENAQGELIQKAQEEMNSPEYAELIKKHGLSKTEFSVREYIILRQYTTETKTDVDKLIEKWKKANVESLHEENGTISLSRYISLLIEQDMKSEKQKHFWE